MKAKEVVFVLFVGVCVILVAATVISGLNESDQSASFEGDQSFSVSVVPTATPAPIQSDQPPAPMRPAQFDEGVIDLTPEIED